MSTPIILKGQDKVFKFYISGQKKAYKIVKPQPSTIINLFEKDSKTASDRARAEIAREGIEDIESLVQTLYDELIPIVDFRDDILSLTEIEDEIVLLSLQDNLNSINTVADNIANLTDIFNDLNKLNDLHFNLLELLEVYSSLNELLNINNNITELLQIHTDLPKLLEIFDNLDNINSVLDNIDEINQIFLNLSMLTDIHTALPSISNVDTNMNSILTIESSLSIITNVEDNLSIITNVNNNIDDINTVSDNIIQLNDIYNNLTELNDIHFNLSMLTDIHGNLPILNNINDNINSILTVETNLPIITNVENDLGIISSVNDNLDNINTVATNEPNINIVANNILSITTVSDNIDQINVIHTNIDEVLSSFDYSQDAKKHAQETTSFFDSNTVEFSKGARGWSIDSENSASNASDSESNALLYRDQSEDFKNLSERWASENKDVIVENGLYSARHYAIIADETVTPFTDHLDDFTNPHQVTKSQVGLSEVLNVEQIPLSEKGVSGGVAPLDNNSYVPIIHINPATRATKVVADITERDAIDQSNRFEGYRVHVIDATDDTTVNTGSAGYILKEGLTNDDWVKTYEAESLDIDSTDDIDEGTTNLYFTEQRAKNAVDKEDVGLGDVPNLDTTYAVNSAHDQNTDTILDQGGTNEISANVIRTHVDSISNPHSVTKSQVGLSNVLNVSQYSQTEIDDFFDGSTSIFGYNKSDWDTAFGWGDHSIEGYLTSIPTTYVQEDDNITRLTNNAGYITDYTVTESDVTQHENALTITESQISDLDKYTQLQIDNFFSGSTTIIGYNKSDWDTAFGWGDHSTIGYLTDYVVTEGDVTQHEGALTITESQISDLSHYTDSDTSSFLQVALLDGDNISIDYDNVDDTFTFNVSGQLANFYLDGLSFDDTTGTLTASVSGTDNQTVGLDGRYSLLGHGHTESDISDLDKYTQLQVDNLLDDKVDKVTGKGLSEEDFTSVLLTKLNGIEAGAEVNEINEAPTDGEQYVRQNSSWAVVNIPEGYDSTDFDSDFDNKSTDDLSEGTVNLYFTDSRAVSAIQNDVSWNASNWDTAFGWGDHSAEGYLTSIPATYVQEDDNISRLTNDAGYITDYTVTEIDVTTHEGAITITESQISDLDKYTQLQVDNLLDNKVNKVEGKGLSEEDFTSVLLTKLNGIEEGAEVNEVNEAPTDGEQYVRQNSSWALVNIPEGYDSTDFDTDFNSKSTDDLSEGTTNLYFTDSRAVTAIQSDVSWNATNWDTAFGWGDHSAEGYLTSIPATYVQEDDNITRLTNDAGYITGYTVTEGDVTQHESALTITESQISDLSHYVDDDVITVLNNSLVEGDNISITYDIDFDTFTFSVSGSLDNFYLDGLTFDDTTGEITASVSGATDQTVNIDGRYSLLGHTHTESDISDLDKYTQLQVDDLLDDKVDKVEGKGLSEEDFTTTLFNKLVGIEAGAEVNEVNEAPSDGEQYVRQDGAWALVNIPEGYDSGDFDTDFATKTTDDLSEGTTNLYFTDSRAVTAIQSDVSWNAGDWDTAFGWGDHSVVGYALETNLNTHISDTTNPHSVTKSQVGLGNVDNVQQIPLSEKGANDGVAPLNIDGIIPTIHLDPKFRSSKVVANITERDAIDSSDRFEGLRVHVIDATDDSTVNTGSAGYILKEPLENTDWVKTYESESLDIDSTDDIDEGSTNLYFTDSRAVSAIQNDPSWNAGNWDSAFGWGDHSLEGYLTSIPATYVQENDDITRLTNNAGYITDYTVTEGDVTQHESALTITESQISDLVHYTNSDALSLLETALVGGSGISITHDGVADTFTFDVVGDLNNYYVDGLTFDNSTGILSVSVSGTDNQTVDLDDRYSLLGHTHTESDISDLDKYSQTEIDEFFDGTTAKTGYNKTNWDTAFGWGDHSIVGYLTSIPTSYVQENDDITRLTNNAGYITDYTVTENDVTQHQTALSITESQISDLTHYTDDDNFDFISTALIGGENVTISVDSVNKTLTLESVGGDGSDLEFSLLQFFTGDEPVAGDIDEDSTVMYLRESGERPNKEIVQAIKNENGDEVIVATFIV